MRLKFHVNLYSKLHYGLSSRPYGSAATARFDWRLRPGSCSKLPKDPADHTTYSYTHRPRATQINLQPGEPFCQAVHTYQDHFLPLLEEEQKEAEAVLNERLSTWSLDRLHEAGYCLSDLSAYWLEGKAFEHPMASFLLGPGLAIPENRLENGSQVLISRIDPLTEKPFPGFVVARSEFDLRVSFMDRFPGLDEGTWRLDLADSDIAYKRMRQAIADLHQDPDKQVSSDAILQGTCLRDVVLRTFSSSAEKHEHRPLQAPDAMEYVSEDTLVHDVANDSQDHWGIFSQDQRIHSWAARYSRPNPVVVEGDPILDGLNEIQTRAMAMMIAQRVSLVQGPPGTGKTKTIIQTVKLLKHHFQVPQPLLVCTYTNVAVDNLVEGLAASGVIPLRVAYGAKVRAGLAEYTLQFQLENHPLKPQIEVREAQIANLRQNIGKMKKTMEPHDSETPVGRRKLQSISEWENRVSSLSGQMYRIRQIMLEDITFKADVICTTCITSATHDLKVTDFPVVFLDEASMSTEPASLVPLMKGSMHLALIGDHKQLPPVITSRKAQMEGLGVSLFERLTEEGVVPSIMLNIQYRMHPAISRFPSLEFYGKSLHDGTCDHQGGNISKRLMPPSSQHLQDTEGHRPSVIFLDHAGYESQKDRSRVNYNEAHIVVSIVEDLLLQNPTLQGRDIGIIAPYVAQISLLTRLFNTNKKYLERFKSVLGEQRAMQIKDIEIKTVDGFEGREKELIIFSTVRNNSGGFIGFLADRRRLNVGLTRAKRGLFVVGSLSTLQSSKTGRRSEEAFPTALGAESWRRFAQYLLDQGLVVKLSGPALYQALNKNYIAAKTAAQRRSTG
ncbi:P-loop containing nucleoside triphosphate hydrolase protein [Mycena floridula]|nr:P-loop containing nucleoside triphosphate hydrolase protein [Mycena floridula]